MAVCHGVKCLLAESEQWLNAWSGAGNWRTLTCFEAPGAGACHGRRKVWAEALAASIESARYYTSASPRRALPAIVLILGCLPLAPLTPFSRVGGAGADDLTSMARDHLYVRMVPRAGKPTEIDALQARIHRDGRARKGWPRP